MINALTIDVEDYFQVHAFSSVIRYEDWCQFDCRVERNTDRLLEILNACRFTPHASRLAKDYSSPSPGAPRSAFSSVKGTFFILGWIAERYPGLVRRIKAEGHEIACHGYAHKLIYEQSREEFREDIRKAKRILENITGNPVIGYRAPSYSIVKRSEWALEILMEEGFQYDSSIFPIKHDVYGMPDAPRFPFLISRNGNSSVSFSDSVDPAFPAIPRSIHSPVNSSGVPESVIRNPQFLIEFPLSTVQVLGMNLPISGGGYFRLFPYSMVKRGLKRVNEVEGRPFIFYLHPWEIDPSQPRVRNIGLKSRFRHCINLSRTEEKLTILLKDFCFCPIRDLSLNAICMGTNGPQEDCH